LVKVNGSCLDIGCVHGFQGGGDHANLSDHGDEIRISRPAGHDMHVQMLRNARSACPTFINTDIPPLRIQREIHQFTTEFDQFPQFRTRLRIVITPHRATFSESDEQVSVAVRIPIEQ